MTIYKIIITLLLSAVAILSLIKGISFLKQKNHVSQRADQADEQETLKRLKRDGIFCAAFTLMLFLTVVWIWFRIGWFLLIALMMGTVMVIYIVGHGVFIDDNASEKWM